MLLVLVVTRPPVMPLVETLRRVIGSCTVYYGLFGVA